jgi:hypothetical protein
MISFRAILVILVFALDLWALAGVTRLASRRRRLRWMARIVLIPVFGALLWARRRRTEAFA